MKYLSAVIFGISLALFSIAPSSGWAAAVAREQISSNIAHSWKEALDYAQENLPKEGQLIMKSDGFGYLKVDDEYIHALFPMLGLKESGFKEPPYFRTNNAPGAHISVFYANEHIKPEEVGQYFRFKLKQIFIVKPSKGKKLYVVLQVESPELEKLREKYGLTPKLFGHDYHISLAERTSRRVN